MKLYVFSLPEVLLKKDPNMVINGLYPFNDGKLKVGEVVGKQIEVTLTRFYECSVEVVDIEPAQPGETAEASLAKHVTKGAPVESGTAANHVTQPKQDPTAPASTTSASVQASAAAAATVTAQTEAKK